MQAVPLAAHRDTTRTTPALIGLLSWYDEKLKTLETAIRTHHQAGLTHIVALDGAYAALPGGKARSSPGQARHIHKVCNELGIICHVHQPDTPWHGNEIQKRQHLFHLGYQAATPDDWFFVIDADHRCQPTGDLPALLASTPSPTVGCLIVEGDTTRFNASTQRRFARLLYRATPGITVGPDNHYTYRAADGTILWGYGEVDAPIAPLVIHNESERARTRSRTLARNAYYAEQPKHETKHHECRVCGATWQIGVPQRWHMQTLPDGTTELTSDTVEFYCEQHAHAVVYDLGRQAHRIANGDRAAASLIVQTMEQAMQVNPAAIPHRPAVPLAVIRQ